MFVARGARGREKHDANGRRDFALASQTRASENGGILSMQNAHFLSLLTAPFIASAAFVQIAACTSSESSGGPPSAEPDSAISTSGDDSGLDSSSGNDAP